jgi:hypothetical protein
LQSGGNTYEFTAGSNTSVFVEGVDGQGITTANKVEIAIEVNPTPNVTLTQGETLSVPQQTDATYQWYLNDAAISGATSASYTPVDNGIYYVVATFATTGCQATSESVDLIVTGLDDFALDISLYPVPARNWLNISSDTNLEDYNFRIVSLDGRLIETNPVISSGSIRFNVTGLTPGIYFVHISNDDSVETLKFVKQ